MVLDGCGHGGIERDWEGLGWIERDRERPRETGSNGYGGGWSGMEQDGQE